jgi:hypothetical protein
MSIEMPLKNTIKNYEGEPQMVARADEVQVGDILVNEFGNNKILNIVPNTMRQLIFVTEKGPTPPYDLDDGPIQIIRSNTAHSYK